MLPLPPVFDGMPDLAENKGFEVAFPESDLGWQPSYPAKPGHIYVWGQM